MYKIIYNDTIIDVLKSIRYGKYIPATGRVIATDKSNADCIVASNLKDRYLLKGVPVPEGCPYIRVSIVPIMDEEYFELIDADQTPIEAGVRRLRESKIEELRNICNKTILEGLQIELSDKKLHHFALSIEDQINLLEIRNLIALGETSFIYHESGGDYQEFSKEDMEKIISEAFKYKQKQLINFNNLKKYINQLTNIDKISKVTYDCKI